MKKLLYLFCSGALLFSGGCSDDGEQNVPRIAFADIVDAESLYLTGKSAGTRASDDVSPSDLFKITFDGSTEKVVFTDKNGKPVDDVRVLSFRRLSDDYIYTFLSLGWTPYHLFIRRSDGAVFRMPDYYSIEDDAIAQTDSNGNLYCNIRTSAISEPICKIYPQGNELCIAQINRDDMNVYASHWWLVDRRGNVWIDDNYIRLASGEFARYSEPPLGISGGCSHCQNRFYVWNDVEGFYIHHAVDPSDHSIPPFTRIEYCRPTSPTSTFEVIKTFENLATTPYLSLIPLVYTDKTVLFSAGAKYRIDIYNKDHIELHEMETHPLPDGIIFGYCGQKYPHTEKYLYGKSESEIWRLSVETGVPEMLYKYDDEFVIKSMTVLNGIVTFTAFELRSGNDVVAEIYPDKTVKVLKSTNGDKIIYFERLN